MIDGPLLPPTWPLPLHHSWPLLDLAKRLPDIAVIAPNDAALAESGMGLWHCTLATNTLEWSAGVFDIFGLPRQEAPCRGATVALYASESREAMERLRAYAIRHRRGFTMDAAIRPESSAPRWMRLVAAPIVDGGCVVALRGIKIEVTDAYRGTRRRGLRMEPRLL